jgi:SAM-dependent methyltransferase
MPGSGLDARAQVAYIDGGWWGRFIDWNKRVCDKHFRPRLYPVSHMTALEALYERWISLEARRFGNDELLEFGCGTEFPCSRLLGRYYKKCAATDVLDLPRSAWPADVEFRQCSSLVVPFEDGRFDAIAIRSVVEHLEEPGATFRELARVLKPGGTIFLNVPNKWDYVSVAARLAGQRKSSLLNRLLKPDWDDFPVFYRCNTERDLRRALAGSGLSVEVLRPLPSEPAYLRFFVPLFLAGAVYQFAISVLSLDALQPAFIAILRKTGEPAGGERAR